MSEEKWVDVGAAAELAAKPLHELRVGTRRIALTCRDGAFGAISGACNHVGGPLGRGHLDGDFVVCPWHYYKFHWQTGEGEPGYEADRVPAHDVKVEKGRVLVAAKARTKRNHLPHEPHPLAREPRREPGLRAPSAAVPVVRIDPFHAQASAVVVGFVLDLDLTRARVPGAGLFEHREVAVPAEYVAHRLQGPLVDGAVGLDDVELTFDRLLVRHPVDPFPCRWVEPRGNLEGEHHRDRR